GLRTDHKPLISALKKVSDTATPFQRRHLLFVSQFASDFAYLPGKSNVIADALSRSNPSTLLEDDNEEFDVQAQVAALVSSSPCSPMDFLASQEADVSLQRWISHHVEDATSPFVPGKLQSQEDPSVSLWFETTSEPPRLLVPSDRQLE
ncbi:pol poly, partial [Paramuricea clavata]